MAPAPVKAERRDDVPAPTRVRAPEGPEPARVLSAEDHAAAAPRPRPVRERRGPQPSDAVVVAPGRGESP